MDFRVTGFFVTGFLVMARVGCRAVRAEHTKHEQHPCQAGDTCWRNVRFIGGALLWCIWLIQRKLMVPDVSGVATHMTLLAGVSRRSGLGENAWRLKIRNKCFTGTLVDKGRVWRGMTPRDWPMAHKPLWRQQ
ncbi:hypothetical protein KP05_13840 [Cobetia amphilecti]|nr:hypothetical protein KP05_13840 [Cobetia amphilecti]